MIWLVIFDIELWILRFEFLLVVICYINFMKKIVFKENNDWLNIYECMYCWLFLNRCNGLNGYLMFI